MSVEWGLALFLATVIGAITLGVTAHAGHGGSSPTTTTTTPLNSCIVLAAPLRPC